jgi:glycosyltransferase involved in cell wall biosynthesis/tetratricopeptide (TPR) repeat protein
MKKAQPSQPLQSKPNIPVSNNFLLSLVIPCYNESARVELMMQGLADFQEKWSGNYEVIIVDDGSKDDTTAKIEQAINGRYSFLKDKTRVERLPANVGKGSALKKGVLLSNGDYILTLDADMSTRPSELVNWLRRDRNLFAGQETIYIGSRKHVDGKIEALQSRKFIGGVFNGIVQVFTSLRLKDTQCGFKLYPRKAGLFLFENMHSKGWEHDVELLYQADLNDINIVEMPISWVNQPESKVNVVKDSIVMLLGVLAISFRIWFYNSFILPFRTPSEATPEQRKHIIYRSVFNTLALLLVIIMPIMSFKFAISGDEHWHYDYGNDIFNYFFHGDTTAQTATSGIQYYGGLFDFIVTSFYNIFHFWDHYTTMHFINAVVGAIGIIYAGKLAKLLGGWNTGILTMILLVLSPSWFGHNFANPKDIPFSTGYIAGIYFIFLFLQALPSPNIKHVFGLICSIGWAMGVRIGGLLLIAYLILFIGSYAVLTKQFKADINKRVIKQVAVIAIAGYFISIICWPWAQLSIFTKPLEALHVMSHFFINIGLLYDGHKILSNQIPWYYIPKYVLYTAPIIVLVGFAIGLLVFVPRFRNNRQLLIFSLFLLFSCFFPVAYAIYQKSSLYDGWRHFLFVYPPLVIIASLGFTYIINSRQAVVRYATILIIIAGLISPVKFAIANHPFESLYYNEIVGGLKNIYGKYETDYYMLGIRPATEWLVQNEHLATTKCTVATNCIFPVAAYLKPYKNVGVDYVRFPERYAKDWDYCILFSRFVDVTILTSGNWPPADNIHTIYVDGVPVAAVLKRKTKKDFLGFELVKAKKIEEAKAMFQASLVEFPQNDPVWEMMARIYDAEGKPDSVLYAGRQALKTFPGDESVYELMGDTYFKMHQPDSARKLFAGLGKYNEALSHYFLAYAAANTGDIRGAFAEIDNSLELDPFDMQTYQLGMKLAQQTHDAGKQEDYAERAKKYFPEQEGE